MDGETRHCKNVSYRLKAILIKIPVGMCVCVCAQIDKLLIKFLQKRGGKNSHSTLQ